MIMRVSLLTFPPRRSTILIRYKTRRRGKGKADGRKAEHEANFSTGREGRVPSVALQANQQDHQEARSLGAVSDQTSPEI